MSRPEKISILEALSFVYIACSNFDDHIDDQEVKTIQRKIVEWSPNDFELAKRSVESAVRWYFDENTDIYEDLETCIDGLKSWGNPENLKAIISDLTAIINADGVVHDREQKFLDLIKARLEV